MCISDYVFKYMCENCMKINVEDSLVSIGQMTHTTHYHPHYSHRSIISLHSILQDAVTFFNWPTLAVTFFFVTFFLAQIVSFSVTFFYYFISEDLKSTQSSTHPSTYQIPLIYLSIQISFGYFEVNRLRSVDPLICPFSTCEKK